MKVSTTTSNRPKEDAMKQSTNTGKVYAGSGSRSLKLDAEMFTRVFNRLIEMIRETKPSLIISGMAEGFDEALALAAMATQTPLKAMIPFKGYCNYYWGKNSVTGKNRLDECKQIVAYAQATGGVEYICSDWRGPDGRYAMFHRNEAMAKACDKAWIWDPSSKGTAQFYNYCVANKIPHYIIKIDGEGPGDTPQIPTPQSPKEDNMKKYIITHGDGTEEVIVSDKSTIQLGLEMFQARKGAPAKKGASIRLYKEEIVNAPQTETIQASIQEAIKPKGEKPMKQVPPQAALIKKELLSQEVQEWLLSILENEIAPMLVKDVSSYAPGRMRTWMPYEAPLDTAANKGKPFTPGVLHDELWQFIVDLCHKHGMKAQTCLISKGGNIKPHRDTTYADAWAMGINLGVCNWHISSTRDGAKPDFTMNLKGGEVFSFNSKHVHAVTDAASDRWAINVWAIADTKAAQTAQIHERITQMLGDNPQVAEFIDHHQPGAGKTEGEAVMNTPQIQAVQEVIQTNKEENKVMDTPQIKGGMNMFSWIEQPDMTTHTGWDKDRKQVDAMFGEQIRTVLTNNPTPKQRQDMANATLGTGATIIDAVRGLWMMPVKMGEYIYPMLERLGNAGVKFTLEVHPLKYAALWYDARTGFETRFGDIWGQGANLKWVDAAHLYTIRLEGIPVGTEFDWTQVGLEVKDAKKMGKRLAELTRLVHKDAWTWFQHKAVIIKPEVGALDPAFEIIKHDGLNAVKRSALPKGVRKHDRIMGRVFCSIVVDGKNVPVLVKGDYLVVNDDMWIHGDAHLAIHMENAKTEVTLAAGQKDLATWWNHEPLHVTTWDQQTLINYPNILTVEDMEADYLHEMNGIDEALKQGRLPGQTEVEDTEVHTDAFEVAPKADEIEKRESLAKYIKDAGFDPRMFENLIGMSLMGFVDSKSRELRFDGNMKGFHGKHMVTMRNSFRAGCVTREFLEAFVGDGAFAGVSTPTSHAYYDERWGMVWNGDHFARSFELHGTHDGDDVHFVLPIKVWSKDPTTIAALKAAGVLLPGVSIPSVEAKAKMLLIVFRIPNGAGEYSLMEFDFATWPQTIDFDESLVKTHELSFFSGWVKPQPMLIPINMPGLTTSRVYSKTAYTKADFAMDFNAQVVNPGFGQLCNALAAYSHLTHGDIPTCMPDSLGNCVDGTQQGADIATFTQISGIIKSISKELASIARSGQMDMNTYVYWRRGSVAKVAAEATNSINFTTDGLYEFDAIYRNKYVALGENIKTKYSFYMRNSVDVVKMGRQMVFSGQEINWAKKFIKDLEKATIEASKNVSFKLPNGQDVPNNKFTAPVINHAKRTARHAVIDSVIAELEAMENVNRKVLALWYVIITPNIMSANSAHGYVDRTLCYMGSKRSIAHMVIDALVSMRESRKNAVGANKVVFTSRKLVDGAFVDHVVKPLQAERATQAPVDIISDIIGKIPQDVNFVWVMADDKPLAVFMRQNSTFAEVIGNLPQTIGV